MDAAERDPGADTEQEVRKYFESRPGWTVEKLDTGKPVGRAPDFRICHGERCFLCEVKTIRSVRADIPEGKVLDHFTEQRDGKQAMVDQWLRENPDRTLLMTAEEWEWLNASDSEFRKKYVGRQRGTEGKFRDHFETPLRQRLESCSVANLPYDLRLDSDDLYLPRKAERDRFVKWLQVQIAAIDRGQRLDWRWVREAGPHRTCVYSTHYPLHEPADGTDTRHPISVRLERRGGDADEGGFRLDVHCYGTLNVERVASNVGEAVDQLREVASREERSRRLPRVVVLRFERGLHPLDDLELLEKEIRGLFGHYDDLSAIAVLQWRPDGHAPPAGEGISAWFRFLEETPWVPFFIVYHNGWLSDATEPLDPHAFSDNWTTHTRVGPQ